MVWTADLVVIEWGGPIRFGVCVGEDLTGYADGLSQSGITVTSGFGA